jgi:predicted nuclease with TOPRIM domain
MPLNMMQLVPPAVAAAVVSAGALLAREVLGLRLGRARLRAEASKDAASVAATTQENLLEQVRMLWTENAKLREREVESRARRRELERQCSFLERRCGMLEDELHRLRQRLDRFDRLLPGPPVHAAAGLVVTDPNS